MHTNLQFVSISRKNSLQHKAKTFIRRDHVRATHRQTHQQVFFAVYKVTPKHSINVRKRQSFKSASLDLASALFWEGASSRSIESPLVTCWSVNQHLSSGSCNSLLTSHHQRKPICLCLFPPHVSLPLHLPLPLSFFVFILQTYMQLCSSTRKTKARFQKLS